MSLEESEKEVRIDKLQTNSYHLVKKIVKIGPVNPEIIQLNEIIKTRNAWQSLAYSPLGATVSPPSKTKPC